MSGSVSEGRFEQRVLNQLLEGVQVLDLDWRYLLVNAEAEKHNRRPASDLLGRRYQDCWPGIEATEVYSRIARVLAGGPADEMENQFEYPDGALGWFELRFLPLPEGVVILSVDVSQRKCAEQNLAKTLRLYRTLSEINQAVVRLREVKPLYQTVCDVAVKFGGFAMAWIGLLNPDSLDVEPQVGAGVPLSPWPFPRINLNEGPLKDGVTATALRTGRVEVVADVQRDARGQNDRNLAQKWGFRGSAAVPFRDGNGSPGVLVLLSNDAGLLGTEADLKLLEEIGGDLTYALAACEQERLLQQWADAFTHSAHGLVIGDPITHRIRTCNPAFAHLMRSTTAQLLNTPYLETYLPEVKRLVEEKLREADEKGSVRFEAVKTRSDGTSFPALIDIVSVRDPRGELLYRVTTLQDMTKSKQLQAELIQAQKLESLGTLSSGVAHDFNNLLAVILGNAQLLRETLAESAPVAKKLDTIITAGYRGAELVKQLLSFARKTDVHFEATDLNAVVTEAMSMLRETFPKIINLDLRLDPDLPRIVADPSQVHQVLVNLGVNARDAMPQGGTATISTRLVLHDGVSYVELAVRDSGTGMDTETRAKIFEPFFTTKPEGKGTGLGLSTVFGILREHHGTVTVESTPGLGTVFRCRFPVAEQQTFPEAPTAPGSPRKGSGTVLLVEDEESLRQAIEERLIRQGYQVLSASQGREAASLFAENSQRIAVVLSDLGLPGQTGDELFRELKTIDPDVRFILASGYFEPGLRERMETEGVAAILQKPYDEDKVFGALEAAARGRG